MRARRIPHTRGGEPEWDAAEQGEALYVFPTRVGVNRIHGVVRRWWVSIPHTRGGEPGRTAG